MKFSFVKIIAFMAMIMMQNNAFAQTKAPETADGLPDKGLLDKIVAIVGDKATLLSDVEDEFQRMQQQQQKALPDMVRCQVLDQIIMQDVMVAQAKLDSVEVPEAEIEQELNARIEQILSFMGGDEEQFQKYYGSSVAEVKAKFREDLKGRKLAQRMQAKIIEDVTVTPSEVKAFFDKIPVDSLPYFNSEVELGQIVLKPKVSDEERKRCMEKLATIRKELMDGKSDFAKLAAQFSDDPGSAKQGGALGFQKRGNLVPEFEAMAYSMKRGEISPIVKTQFGYHIIQLIERRGNNINTRHILIKPKVGDMELAATKVRLDSIREAIMADSVTFEAAVQRFSEDDASKANAGTMTNPQTGSPYFEVGDLQPEIYFAIDNLKEKGITQPLEAQQPDGSTEFRIVMLRSRSEPHQASLETDYNKIKSATLEQKKAKAMNDWMISHVGKIYIKVNPPFDACPNMDKWKEVPKN